MAQLWHACIATKKAPPSAWLPRSVWVLDLKTLAFERVKKQGAHGSQILLGLHHL